MTPTPRPLLAGLVGASIAAAASVAAIPGAPASGAEPRWSWPLRGVLGAPYRAPPTPYAAGHRGIDIDAAAGTPVLAPADGVVTFAGPVGGRPVLAVLHADGVTSSFDPVEPSVVLGQAVAEGETLGVVAASVGHCPMDCLHLGARVDGRYLSPLALLESVPRAVLLPLAP